jgi:NADH:ubiquinone oxidoreductase subunit E
LWRCKEGPNLLIDKQIFNKMDPAKASKRIFNK